MLPHPDKGAHQYGKIVAILYFNPETMNSSPPLPSLFHTFILIGQLSRRKGQQVLSTFTSASIPTIEI